MDFLIEAILEAAIQLIGELIIAILDFALESLLGRQVAERVRVSVSACFYLLLGAFGGWISALLLPKPMGGTALPIAYFLFLPLVTAGLLFLTLNFAEKIKERHSTRVLVLYCVVVSWAFSISRYFCLI